MIELLHLSPALVLTIINTLTTASTLAFLVSVIGVFLLAPLLSMSGRVSAGVGLIGIFMVFGGLAGGFYCIYEIDCLQNARGFMTTPGYSFNTSDYQPIVSLSDGQAFGMSGGGSFFLGIGSISVNGKTTPQYVFYKNPADGYQLGTLPAEDVIIREDAASDSARIEWLYQHTVSEKKIFTDNNETVGGGESVALIKKYIHVPKGTIRVQYDLDSNLQER